MLLEKQALAFPLRRNRSRQQPMEADYALAHRGNVVTRAQAGVRSGTPVMCVSAHLCVLLVDVRSEWRWDVMKWHDRPFTQVLNLSSVGHPRRLVCPRLPLLDRGTENAAKLADRFVRVGGRQTSQNSSVNLFLFFFSPW
jgi:hypothetical protein